MTSRFKIRSNEQNVRRRACLFEERSTGEAVNNNKMMRQHGSRGNFYLKPALWPLYVVVRCIRFAMQHIDSFKMCLRTFHISRCANVVYGYIRRHDCGASSCFSAHVHIIASVLCSALYPRSSRQANGNGMAWHILNRTSCLSRTTD